MIFGTPLFWRETHKPGRFLIFEGRVVIVLLLMVMHLRVWTVVLAFSVMAILYYFDRKGVPADSILRYLRARFVGRKRSARGVHNERVAVDFHFEPAAYRRHLAIEAAVANRPEKRTFASMIGLGGPKTAPGPSGDVSDKGPVLEKRADDD